MSVSCVLKIKFNDLGILLILKRPQAIRHTKKVLRRITAGQHQAPFTMETSSYSGHHAPLLHLYHLEQAGVVKRTIAAIGRANTKITARKHARFKIDPTFIFSQKVLAFTRLRPCQIQRSLNHHFMHVNDNQRSHGLKPCIFGPKVRCPALGFDGIEVTSKGLHGS